MLMLTAYLRSRRSDGDGVQELMPGDLFQTTFGSLVNAIVTSIIQGVVALEDIEAVRTLHATPVPQKAARSLGTACGVRALTHFWPLSPAGRHQGSVPPPLPAEKTDPTHALHGPD